MSISFEKYRTQIIAAWNNVLDDKDVTNWSLYGYEGQTNELKVVAIGEGGLEELCDELNSGKIMYAFARIIDPKTGLKKFLLINWQGEGAPVLRKGTCANHIHDVAKILSGAHLTINARNEDDIDLERLLKKLSTVSSTYSFKEPRTIVDEPKGLIGTNYSRVIPTKELNPSVMQDFWKKEEEEEKKRIEAEKELKRQQLVKLEQEQRTREEKEHQQREKNVASTTKLQSAHVPIKTSPQPLSPEKTTASFNSGMTEAERMRQMRNQEARELIGSRVGAAKAIFTKNTSEGQLQTKLNTAPPAKPARTSIAQRINAFNQTQQQQYEQQKPIQNEEKHKLPGKLILPKEIIDDTQQERPPQYSQNQLEEMKLLNDLAASHAVDETIKEPEVTEDNNLNIAISSIDNPQQHHHDEYENEVIQPVKPEMTAIANEDVQPLMDDYLLNENEEQFSTIKRSPHSKSNSLQSPDETSSSNATDTAVYQNDDVEVIRTKVSVTVQQSQSQSSKNGLIGSLERNDLNDMVNEDDFICQDTIGDLGLRARALYDYQAADESEITFDPGDIITHIDQIDEGWWQGLGPDGTYGLFPANYVEIIT